MSYRYLDIGPGYITFANANNVKNITKFKHASANTGTVLTGLRNEVSRVENGTVTVDSVPVKTREVFQLVCTAPVYTETTDREAFMQRMEAYFNDVLTAYRSSLSLGFLPSVDDTFDGTDTSA